MYISNTQSAREEATTSRTTWKIVSESGKQPSAVRPFHSLPAARV